MTISEFELANEQRGYFGLTPVVPEWERVVVDQVRLYYDGDVIRKVIWYGDRSGQFGYAEFDCELATQDRTQLLPEKRGKSRPITPSNVTARKPTGFSFRCTFGWKGKTFRYEHLAVTFGPTGAELVQLEDHGLTTFDALKEWVDRYIAERGDRIFEQIEEVRAQKRRRVRYKVGDVFEIGLPGGRLAYGRILVDMFALSRSRRGNPRSDLNSPITASGLLIEVFGESFAERPAVESLTQLPRLPSRYVFHDQILHAKFPIVGNLAVMATEIDFPEFVSRFNSRPYFHKGDVVADLPLPANETDAFPRPTAGFGLSPGEIENFLTPGRQPAREWPDLRFRTERAGVLASAGLPATKDYDELARATGALTRAEMLDIMKEAGRLPSK